jgi:hypothetical protein
MEATVSPLSLSLLLSRSQSFTLQCFIVIPTLLTAGTVGSDP